MSRNWSIYFLILVYALLAGCKPRPAKVAAQKAACVKVSSMPVTYAHGFAVDYYDGFKVITVKDVMDTGKVLARYVIHAKGKPAPVGFEDAILLDMPVRRVVCISTTHIAEMARLGLTDSIAAVTNVSLIYDSNVVAKVGRGEIADLGNEELNYEKLLVLDPTFVLLSGSYDGGEKLRLKLNALHVKPAMNFEYMEQDPLARVEWLKFIGAFYDKEALADSIFKQTEMNYISLKEKVKAVSSKPTIFCNIPVKDIWYMPCGANYVARLIDDAGGNFLWKDAKATNGLNLNLDYEQVYSKADKADIWLYPGFATSLKEISKDSRKDTFFKAYKTGQVYNNNKRMTANGGFDWWESGVVYPDKILADLIYIFHPDLLPGHELYYYQKLK